MADSRFFKSAGAVSLEEAVALTGARAVMRGGAPADLSRRFTDVAPLDRAKAEHVSFLDNVKYIGAFEQSGAGACFVRPAYTERAPQGMALLVTDQPYRAYALVARRLYPELPFTPGVSPQAAIAKSAAVGKGVRIDTGAVIGENAAVGDGSWIGANTVIADGVTIGTGCRIGALCSISHAVLGNNLIIHRGVHIGQDGFGFAPGDTGALKVPQLGRVVIGNDVEIGSGTCIDRGAGPDTVIGDGSKIDNLVQIGHNATIGRHVMIAAQCGIAGSCEIGDGAMLGGQSGFSGHLKVGAGAKIAAQAGVMTDVPPGATYGGGPAMPIKDWHRQTVAVAKLVTKQGE